MATKLAAAHKRLFKNLFFCKVCKQRIKVDPSKILSGKVSCRRCKSKSFRPVNKK
ncbi:MAG: hypothetical protein QXG18_01555 [Candidatus Pacearchaeota archaeon]